eukprot:65707-Prymnesium_polylepis.1
MTADLSNDRTFIKTAEWTLLERQSREAAAGDDRPRRRSAGGERCRVPACRQPAAWRCTAAQGGEGGGRAGAGGPSEGAKGREGGRGHPTTTGWSGRREGAGSLQVRRLRGVWRAGVGRAALRGGGDFLCSNAEV